MREYRNYIFDLYGTLADIHTDEQSRKFWQDMAVWFSGQGACYEADELKYTYFEEIDLQKTKLPAGGEVDLALVFAELYQKKGKKVTDAQIRTTAEVFRQTSMRKLKLFEGVLALFQRLKQQGKKIYLLSNAQVLFTEPELRYLNLEPWLDGILLSSDAGYKKPSKTFYQMLLDRYGLKTEDSVMVGNDDDADCWGAYHVGLASMYIFTEQSPKRVRPLPPNCKEIADIGEVY